MRRIAIIPARGGSKRLPRKNILPLGGRPMLMHPIITAKETGLFDEIIVSTEDEEIKNIAADTSAIVYSRNSELATDQATVQDVCVDLMKQLQAKNNLPDIFCVIYPTAAFLIKEDIIESEKRLHDIQKSDVVMGVSNYPIHPYKALSNESGFLKPVFPEENNQKSQTYPHWVASNGTFYWMRTDSFCKRPNFYPEKLIGYEVPHDRAIDIDTPEDFEWAKILMEAKMRGVSC